jgi:hypothetical protein
MPRTPSRRGRRRRHEISVQVVQDIQSLHVENTDMHSAHSSESTEHTQYAEDTEQSQNEPLGAPHRDGKLQLWKASSSEYETTCELFSTDDTSFICPIMHEPTCSAIVEDLPSTWPPGNIFANSVQLQMMMSFICSCRNKKKEPSSIYACTLSWLLLWHCTSSQQTCDVQFVGQGALCSWS